MENKIEKKTFESRLKFIREVFENKQSQDEILTSCIQFKLGKSYENYLEDVNNSLNTIRSTAIPKNPISVLKKVNKEELS